MSNERPAPLDLARLRKLIAKATPGPFRYDIDDDIVSDALPAEENIVGHLYRMDDAAFYTEARTAIPGLLDELEAARRERDQAVANFVESQANGARVSIDRDRLQAEVERLRGELAGDAMGRGDFADRIADVVQDNLRADRDHWKARAEAAERELSAAVDHAGSLIDQRTALRDELAAAQRRIEALERVAGYAEHAIGCIENRVRWAIRNKRPSTEGPCSCELDARRADTALAAAKETP